MYVGRTYVERSGQSRGLIYRRVTLDSYNMGTDKPVALKQRTILSKPNKILDAQITKFSLPLCSIRCACLKHERSAIYDFTRGYLRFF